MSNVHWENERSLECLDSCFSIPQRERSWRECYIFGLPPVSEIPAVLEHLCLTTTVNNKVIQKVSVVCQTRGLKVTVTPDLHINVLCNIALFTNRFMWIVHFLKWMSKNMQHRIPSSLWGQTCVSISLTRSHRRFNKRKNGCLCGGYQSPFMCLLNNEYMLILNLSPLIDPLFISTNTV